MSLCWGMSFAPRYQNRFSVGECGTYDGDIGTLLVIANAGVEGEVTDRV